MVRTLIILCAGNHKRNCLPIYLNHHPDGELLAVKAMKNVYPETYDKIIYTILQEDCEKYKAHVILQKAIPVDLPIEIFTLKMPTAGPAESAYQTVREMGITGEIAIRDCVNAICLDKSESGNFVAGLDLYAYEREIYRVHEKSFIVTNEQEQILDIVEKSFRSDIISVGLYGFRRAADFIMAYERLNDRNYPIKSLYLSNIISYLIGYRKLIFNFARVTGYEDWKNPDEWVVLRETHGHTKLVMVDLDGTLFDTRKVNYLAYEEAVNHHGFHLDFQYYCDYCNGKHYMDFLPQVTTKNKQTLYQIHAEKKAAYRKYLKHAVVNQPLLDIIRLMGKEYRKVLVTMASKENTYDILSYYGLTDIFDLILTHDDIEKSKPDPECYLKAIAHFSAVPEECIVFEDSDDGVEAAMQSGAKCYVVKGFR